VRQTAPLLSPRHKRLDVAASVGLPGKPLPMQQCLQRPVSLPLR
jgi:hypothetical protein